MKRLQHIAAFFVAVTSATIHADDKNFDAYVSQAMEQWQVPGLAIAIVKKGEVAMVRGYGVWEVGGDRPVTEQTPFAIASCTKAFTAVAIARLVDEGKLHWDDPVRKHLRDFELFDPYLTREVTIRDLLAHRTGLENANLLWSSNKFTPDEIMKRLRHVRPARSFRGGFHYNNLMYLVAGRIVEKASGRTWGQAVQEDILRPLDMKSSTVEFPVDANIAWPHGVLDGKAVRQKMEPNYASAIASSGAIWSSAADMAKWVRWNLDSIQEDNPRLRPATLREMHSPQAIIPARDKGTRYPAKEYASYGLGWFVEDYRGKKLVRQSGSGNGYIAWVSMLPSERFGFVILANSHRTGINFALHHRILDEYLGEPVKDWSTIVWKDYTGGWQRMLRESRAAYERKRLADTRPELPLPALAGTYQNDLYGDLVIREVEGGLQLDFGPRRIAPLKHWQNNTFEADFKNSVVEDWHVTFQVGTDRRVSSVRAFAAPWAPGWHDDRVDLGEFRRVKSPSAQ